MGGFLSRARRREVKEETSPRSKSEAEAKSDQNQIEVNRHKKPIAESQFSDDEITIGVDPIEECESTECIDLVRNPSDGVPVEEISLADYADPELPHNPSSEEEVVDVNIAEDNNREMRSASPSLPDVIQELLPNDNENVVNVDVSHEQSHPESYIHKVDDLPDSSFHKVEEPVVPSNYREEEVDVNVEEPEYDLDVVSPPVIPFIMPEDILIDEDSDVIVDVLSEETRPAFDPSIHLMAEPVIFHPQPLPVEDAIDLDMDIDDELVKRKKRTLENPSIVHPESKESQPGLDDE